MYSDVCVFRRTCSVFVSSLNTSPTIFPKGRFFPLLLTPLFLNLKFEDVALLHLLVSQHDPQVPNEFRLGLGKHA